MTKKQFEKFKENLEEIKGYFIEAVKDVIIDNTLNNYKAGKFISKKMGVSMASMTYFYKIAKGQKKANPRIETIIKFLDAYFEYKETSK